MAKRKTKHKPSEVDVLSALSPDFEKVLERMIAGMNHEKMRAAIDAEVFEQLTELGSLEDRFKTPWVNAWETPPREKFLEWLKREALYYRAKN